MILKRSLSRALLKGCSAPEPYWAEVPVHDPSTGRNDKMASIPFILPHELLHNLLQKDPDLLAALSGSQLEPGLENFAKQKPNKTQKKQVCKTSRTSSVPSLVSPLTSALAWVSLEMVD